MVEVFLDEPNEGIIAEGMNYMISLLVMLVFMTFFRCFIGVFTGEKRMKPVLIAFAMNIISRVAFAYVTFPFIGKWAIYITNPLSVLVGAAVIVSFYRYKSEAKDLVYCVQLDKVS